MRSRPVTALMRWTASIVASVPELQKRQSGWPKACCELLGDDDRVLGRLGEVRASADLGPHRLDDRRMGVPGEAGAVAAVQVDVLGPVDVVDLGAGPVAQPDGLRARDLPARGHPAGERAPGPRDELARPGLAIEEERLLLGHDRVEPRGEILGGGQLDYHDVLRFSKAWAGID